MAWLLSGSQSSAFYLWRTMTRNDQSFSVGILIFGKCQKMLIILTYLDIQIYTSLTPPVSLLLERSQSTTFFWLKTIQLINSRRALAMRSEACSDTHSLLFRGIFSFLFQLKISRSNSNISPLSRISLISAASLQQDSSSTYWIVVAVR